jgi:hypothetical protein
MQKSLAASLCGVEGMIEYEGDVHVQRPTCKWQALLRTLALCGYLSRQCGVFQSPARPRPPLSRVLSRRRRAVPGVAQPCILFLV